MSTEKRKDIIYENAIIIAAHLDEKTASSLNEEIDELILLSDTAGALILDKIIQKKTKIDSATFIGSGKIKSAINNAKELDIKVITQDEWIKMLNVTS